MSGYVAGVAFIAAGLLVYAIALRAARATFAKLEPEPPTWQNDPTLDPEWWTRDLERRTS